MKSKQDDLKQSAVNTELFYILVWVLGEHPTSGQVFIMNERVNERISWSIFNAMRTGNEFNTTMRTGSGLK